MEETPRISNREGARHPLTIEGQAPHEWAEAPHEWRGASFDIDIFVVTTVSYGPKKKIKVEFLAEQAALRETGEGLRGERRTEGTRKIGNHWQKGRKRNKSNRRGHGEEGSWTDDGSMHDGMSEDSFRLLVLSLRASANSAVIFVRGYLRPAECHVPLRGQTPRPGVMWPALAALSEVRANQAKRANQENSGHLLHLSRANQGANLRANLNQEGKSGLDRDGTPHRRPFQSHRDILMPDQATGLGWAVAQSS
jgi:hypothetical protein